MSPRRLIRHFLAVILLTAGTTFLGPVQPAQAAVCATYTVVAEHIMGVGDQSYSMFPLLGSIISGTYNQNYGYHNMPTIVVQVNGINQVWVGHYNDTAFTETSSGWHALAWVC